MEVDYNQLGVNTPVASELIHHKKYSLYFKINFWTWKHFQKGTSFHGVINQTALWTSTHWYFVWNPNTFLKKGNSLPSCSELRFHLPHSIKWQYHIRYFRSIIILKTDLTLHCLSKKKCLSHENFIYWLYAAKKLSKKKNTKRIYNSKESFSQTKCRKL